MTATGWRPLPTTAATLEEGTILTTINAVQQPPAPFAGGSGLGISSSPSISGYPPHEPGNSMHALQVPDPAPALGGTADECQEKPMLSEHLQCSVVGCGKRRHGLGLCVRHYRQHHRAQPKCGFPKCSGSPRFAGLCRAHEPWFINADRGLAVVVHRFAQSLRPNGECWEWVGEVKNSGYGIFNARGLKWHAHRWAYGYFTGAHTTRQELDHVCRNRLCVRPDHLFPVGRAENARLRERRAANPGKWIMPRRYRRIWTPRADEFAIIHGLPSRPKPVQRQPASVYDLAA